MMHMEKQIDFLAIGDIVTEPFIRIKDAEAHCDLDQANCKLCLRFGDKVPYESAEVCRAVGNSANAAVSAARLGINSYLMSYIGNDDIGKGNLEELTHNGVKIDLMQTVPGMPSNYHYVLWYSVERTILVNHTEFPYSFPMNLPAPKWIYLSSLASNSTEYHIQIAEYLNNNPEVKLAFQPGTFQMKLGIDLLKSIYEHTEVFFCNKEEAQRILSTEEKDEISLMDGLQKLGPKIVVVTDGIKGAYARDTDGSCYFMPVYPHAPHERTGAGDAFASTVATFLCKGNTLAEALTYAPINAMSVTLQVGAQKGLISEEKIMEYLQDAPEDYKIKKIR
jgi:sugar/nucleoside kinase (ribokinase family)